MRFLLFSENFDKALAKWVFDPVYGFIASYCEIFNHKVWVNYHQIKKAHALGNRFRRNSFTFIPFSHYSGDRCSILNNVFLRIIFPPQSSKFIQIFTRFYLSFWASSLLRACVVLVVHRIKRNWGLALTPENQHPTETYFDKSTWVLSGFAFNIIYRKISNNRSFLID